MNPHVKVKQHRLNMAPTPHLRGTYPSYEGQVPLISGVGKQHFSVQLSNLKDVTKRQWQI